MTCTHCGRNVEADSVYCRFCGTTVTQPGDRPRLTRLSAEGKIAGVCAGIADYFQIDVALVRLAWVILSIIPGAIIGGVLAYLIAWLLIPDAVPSGHRPAAGKRLMSSATDRRMAGVCGGLGEYLGIDSTMVRVAWVVLSIYPGAIICGVLAYVVAWFVIPKAPSLAFTPAPLTP